MSCHVMSWHSMPCHAMPCHVMSCHAMPCHEISCHVMSSHLISFHRIASHRIASHLISYHVISSQISFIRDATLSRSAPDTMPSITTLAAAAASRASLSQESTITHSNYLTVTVFHGDAFAARSSTRTYKVLEVVLTDTVCKCVTMEDGDSQVV